METQTIKNLKSQGEIINQIMQQSINLNEVNLYLSNIDKLAMLCEEGDLSEKEIYLEQYLHKQNSQLLKILQSKILEIILDSNIQFDTIINHAQKVKMVLGDSDICALQQSGNIKLMEEYVVAKIIAEDLDMRHLHEKSL